MGVDEKALRKGHNYLTLVNDLERSRVLYVAEERKQSSLDGFWGTLTQEEMASIEAVAMDMWDPHCAHPRQELSPCRTGQVSAPGAGSGDADPRGLSSRTFKSICVFGRLPYNRLRGQVIFAN